MSFTEIIETIERALDLAGVVAIAGGIALVTFFTLRELASGTADLFRTYRRRVGKVILLGLELLVAADIIRTVAIAPTLEGVAVLALIVLIRTFLSFSLEVELYGQWPWRRGSEHASGASA